MTRFCRACRTSKPHDEFEGPGRCRACARAGRPVPTVRVALPPGWSSDQAGLPEMTLPTRADIEAGYDGDLWTASKRSWRLEIRWRGDHAMYHCRAFRVGDDRYREARSFEYPHEVVDWMSIWFAQLTNVKD